jgi:hypothetical protein
MTGLENQRLVRLLGGETLAGRRRRLRQRFERATLPGTFRLNGLTDIERNALASLLGCKPCSCNA